MAAASKDWVEDWIVKTYPGLNCIAPLLSNCRPLKRRATMSDITPRAKRARQATNPLTPSVTTSINAGDFPPARSSTTTSRSSSPSKKQAQIEAEFSKPAHRFHARASAKRWKEQNQRQIPLFDELQSAIHGSTAESMVDIDPQLMLILNDLEQCQERDATEEMWSDTVVYPALQLARRLSQHHHSIDVINVKSIDVKPPHLLPRRGQSSTSLSIQGKRVDYTIGLKIADDGDYTLAILSDVDNHTLAQNPHKMIRDRALCAHIEIKTGDTASSGDAKLQHFTWCAAGFAKQEELWLERDRRRTQYTQAREASVQPKVEQLAPIPLLRWTKDSVEVSIAVADSARERIDILDEKKMALDSTDVESLRSVIDMMVRIMDWGCTMYLPWFKYLFGEEDWRA